MRRSMRASVGSGSAGAEYSPGIQAGRPPLRYRAEPLLLGETTRPPPRCQPGEQQPILRPPVRGVELPAHPLLHVAWIHENAGIPWLRRDRGSLALRRTTAPHSWPALGAP